MTKLCKVVSKNSEQDLALSRASDCLCLVYHHFGMSFHPEKVRVELGYSASIELGLVAVATASGFRAKRQKIRKLGQLKTQTSPFIVGWSGPAFVVVEQALEDGFIILDPMVGRRYLGTDAFGEMFTGQLVSLTPLEGQCLPRRSVWGRLRQWMPWAALR